jgi:hypothetical protein
MNQYVFGSLDIGDFLEWERTVRIKNLTDLVANNNRNGDQRTDTIE